MATTRSATAAAFTVVVVVALSLPGVTSASVEPTTATFVSVPAVSGRMLKVICAEPLTASAPSEQMTVPALFVQLPCEVAAEMYSVFAGRAFVTRTLADKSGPAFVTSMV